MTQQPRFIIEGFCGGDYAGIYDRKHGMDVSQYTERKGFTVAQLERIANELNAKYAEQLGTPRRRNDARDVVEQPGAEREGLERIISEMRHSVANSMRSWETGEVVATSRVEEWVVELAALSGEREQACTCKRVFDCPIHGTAASAPAQGHRTLAEKAQDSMSDFERGFPYDAPAAPAEEPAARIDNDEICVQCGHKALNHGSHGRCEWMTPLPKEYESWSIAGQLAHRRTRCHCEQFKRASTAPEKLSVDMTFFSFKEYDGCEHHSDHYICGLCAKRHVGELLGDRETALREKLEAKAHEWRTEQGEHIRMYQRKLCAKELRRDKSR